MRGRDTRATRFCTRSTRRAFHFARSLLNPIQVHRKTAAIKLHSSTVPPPRMPSLIATSQFIQITFQHTICHTHWTAFRCTGKR